MQWSRGSTDEVIEKKSAEKALARSLQIGSGERGDESVIGTVSESPRPVAPNRRQN
jgi:hypothetical protein